MGPVPLFVHCLGDLGLDLARDHVPAGRRGAGSVASPTVSRSPPALIALRLLATRALAAVSAARARAARRAGRADVRLQLHRRLSRRAVRRVGARRRAVLDDGVHEPRRHAARVRHADHGRARSSGATLGVGGVALLFLPELLGGAQRRRRRGWASRSGSAARADRDRRQPGVDADAAPRAADLRDDGVGDGATAR